MSRRIMRGDGKELGLVSESAVDRRVRKPAYPDIIRGDGKPLRPDDDIVRALAGDAKSEKLCSKKLPDVPA